MRVLDVRRATEHAEGHLPGSVNIAHTRLAARLDEVPDGHRLLVHCRSGVRSGRATAMRSASRPCGPITAACLPDSSRQDRESRSVGQGEVMLLYGTPNARTGSDEAPNVVITTNAEVSDYLLENFVGRLAAFRDAPAFEHQMGESALAERAAHRETSLPAADDDDV